MSFSELNGEIDESIKKISAEILERHGLQLQTIAKLQKLENKKKVFVKIKELCELSPPQLNIIYGLNEKEYFEMVKALFRLAKMKREIKTNG